MTIAFQPVWSFLAMVAVMILGTSIVVDGAVLPTTITSRLYTSTDDAIPTGGTTLTVQSMLDDAAVNNRTEALFNATRLTFGGTLTIALPTTASAWTDSNIPLRIFIKDGTSGAVSPWPATFIQVTGVLALGSSITVHGGNYNFTSQFFNLPSGLTIQDGSTLAIDGGTFRAHYPGSSMYTSLVNCRGKSLVISNSGTLSISNYDMTVGSVTASGTWYWSTLHVSNVAITVSKNSTLSISNAKVHVSDVTLGGDNTFWMISLYATNSMITVSSSSTLAIDNNEVTIANVDVHTFYVYEIHAINTPVTVHTNSFISLSHGTTSVTNVKTKGWWAWITYYPASSPNSDTTIHTNSSIIITNNSGVADTVYVGDAWLWYSVYANVSPLTVTTSSNLTITNNNMKASNVQNVNNLWWYALHSVNYPVTVINNSTINIANIHMEISDVNVVGGWFWVAMYTADSPNAPASIRTFSTVTISNVCMVATNVVVNSGMKMLLLFSKSTPTSITSSSTISISNNSMSVTNLKGGVNWHTVYNTASVYTINTGGTLALSKNTLAATIIAGSLTANEVWSRSYTYTALGVHNTATGACDSNRCSGTDSSGVYTCGGDGSSVNNLVFDCTTSHTTTPTPTWASTTSSPNGHAGYNDLDTGAVIGIVVGVIVILGLGIVISICIICNHKNAPPPAEGGGVEMTYTSNHHSQPEPRYNSEPVLGVPVQMPVEGQSSKQPYGGGGSYL